MIYTASFSAARFYSLSFRPSAARAGIQGALAVTTCVFGKGELDSRVRGNDDV